jgi:hypothetical protein
MLTSDSTYLKAKKIKNKEDKLAIEFQYLNEFILSEYSVNILNADIYYEPIFKDLGPKLRLIIDSNVEDSNLPIYYKDRYSISKKFLEIISSLSLDYNLNIEYEKLNIEYIIFEQLFYEETIGKLSNKTIIESLNDPSIIKLSIFWSEYVFFYKDSEVVNSKKNENFDKKYREIIIELVKQKGYNGNYLNKISIIFDSIESLEKAGSEYNYMR